MARTHFFQGSFETADKCFIDSGDISILRGYGVFDFLRTKRFVPLFVEDYIERFLKSAKEMHLPIDYTAGEIKSLIAELIRINAEPQSGIRLVLTGGVSENAFRPGKPSFMIRSEELHMPSDEVYRVGVKLVKRQFVRSMPKIKTTNYAYPVWLSHQWKAQGAEDVLYYEGQEISESSRANFFIIKGNQLITNYENILFGITRKRVLELAKSKLEVKIRAISLADLASADEAFITSTTKRILPVVSVDDQHIGRWTSWLLDCLFDAAV